MIYAYNKTDVEFTSFYCLMFFMNKKIYGGGISVILCMLFLSGCGEAAENMANGERQALQNQLQNGTGQGEQNRRMSDGGSEQKDHNGSGMGQGEHLDITDIPMSDLNDVEIADIMQMREEEKLARDVYITLGEKWGKNVFLNIQGSEDSHTSEVQQLIDRYDLDDPVIDDTVGVFTSNEMKTLYEKLIAQGDVSLLDALIVGATIEDLDIYDLDNALERTDSDDVIAVYTNLLEGSKRHMQSFVKNITKEGGEYIPTYISQEEFDEIIAMEREYGGKSNGGGNGGGMHDGTGGGTGNGGQGGMNQNY